MNAQEPKNLLGGGLQKTEVLAFNGKHSASMGSLAAAMSRKITLQVPVEMKVRDRDVKVLALLDSRTTRTGSEVVVSLRTLASELETSVDTARRALSSCIDEGYLNVYQNRLENGCQIENSYALTPRGAAVLGAARDAGIVG